MAHGTLISERYDVEGYGEIVVTRYADWSGMVLIDWIETDDVSSINEKAQIPGPLLREILKHERTRTEPYEDVVYVVRDGYHEAAKINSIHRAREGAQYRAEMLLDHGVPGTWRVEAWRVQEEDK